MNVTLACFSKDCNKPRFLGYYVCAEHFVYYAAPRYTESMAIEIGPVTYSGLSVEASSCASSQSKHTARKPRERRTATEARVA
jgi:hypothetical protein